MGCQIGNRYPPKFLHLALHPVKYVPVHIKRQQGGRLSLNKRTSVAFDWTWSLVK